MVLLLERLWGETECRLIDRNCAHTQPTLIMFIVSHDTRRLTSHSQWAYQVIEFFIAPFPEHAILALLSDVSALQILMGMWSL